MLSEVFKELELLNQSEAFAMTQVITTFLVTIVL